ncbi:MAG: hypothetical protein EZS28_032545 [Streblomastix strix]|uniref:ATP-dependent RNA helicase Ski2/MTR4 C-terminal domain-containing protein n=1 Tax=Streblomastix strix TaxID=222440 RepID=A0A5J4UNC2_9EUKA|nr:MAG: hypothetical protein EZS28_032545 [Streblomastix strix]
MGLHWRNGIDALRMVDNREAVEGEKQRCETQLMNDLHQYIELLKKGQYITTDGMITIKGRAACELDQNAFIIMELIADNFFSQISASEAMAAISAFVNTEKGQLYQVEKVYKQKQQQQQEQQQYIYYGNMNKKDREEEKQENIGTGRKKFDGEKQEDGLNEDNKGEINQLDDNEKNEKQKNETQKEFDIDEFFDRLAILHQKLERACLLAALREAEYIYPSISEIIKQQSKDRQVKNEQRDAPQLLDQSNSSTDQHIDPDSISQYEINNSEKDLIYSQQNPFDPPLLDPSLVAVTLRWTEGATFKDACEFSSQDNQNKSIMEGSVIKTLLRTAGLARSIANCARVLGDNRLVEMMNNGENLLLRGIVNNNSLYLSSSKTKEHE